MENSIVHDYVTEKIWDGLAAGCVPIYLGSNSIGSYVPDPKGIIVYDPKGKGNASTPEELDALLHSIGSNKTRYEEMVAWKSKKVHGVTARVLYVCSKLRALCAAHACRRAGCRSMSQ